MYLMGKKRSHMSKRGNLSSISVLGEILQIGKTEEERKWYSNFIYTVPYTKDMRHLVFISNLIATIFL